MGEEQGYQYYDWIIDFLKLPVSKLDIWQKRRVVRPDRVGVRQSLVRYSSAIVSQLPRPVVGGVHTTPWPGYGVPYIVRSYSAPVIREHPSPSLLPPHSQPLNTLNTIAVLRNENFPIKMGKVRSIKWEVRSKVWYFDASNWSNVAPRTIENCFWQQHLFWLLLFSSIYLLWTYL